MTIADGQVSSLSFIPICRVPAAAALAGADDPKELGRHCQAPPCAGEHPHLEQIGAFLGLPFNFLIFLGMECSRVVQHLMVFALFDGRVAFIPESPAGKVVETERPQTLQKVVKRRTLRFASKLS